MADSVELTETLNGFLVHVIGDKGFWTDVSPKDAPMTVFEGFGGEEFVTIHFISMQDGTATFALVKEKVDSSIEVIPSARKKRDDLLLDMREHLRVLLK